MVTAEAIVPTQPDLTLLLQCCFSRRWQTDGLCCSRPGFVGRSFVVCDATSYNLPAHRPGLLSLVHRCTAAYACTAASYLAQHVGQPNIGCFPQATTSGTCGPLQTPMLLPFLSAWATTIVNRRCTICLGLGQAMLISIPISLPSSFPLGRIAFAWSHATVECEHAWPSFTVKGNETPGKLRPVHCRRQRYTSSAPRNVPRVVVPRLQCKRAPAPLGCRRRWTDASHLGFSNTSRLASRSIPFRPKMDLYRFHSVTFSWLT